MARPRLGSSNGRTTAGLAADELRRQDNAVGWNTGMLNLFQQQLCSLPTQLFCENAHGRQRWVQCGCVKRVVETGDRKVLRDREILVARSLVGSASRRVVCSEDGGRPWAALQQEPRAQSTPSPHHPGCAGRY